MSKHSNTKSQITKDEQILQPSTNTSPFRDLFVIISRTAVPNETPMILLTPPHLVFRKITILDKIKSLFKGKQYRVNALLQDISGKMIETNSPMFARIVKNHPQYHPITDISFPWVFTNRNAAVLAMNKHLANSQEQINKYGYKINASDLFTLEVWDINNDLPVLIAATQRD